MKRPTAKPAEHLRRPRLFTPFNAGRGRILPLFLLGVWLGSTAFGLAEIPRALAAGTIPDDHRLAPLKDLDGYFPFVPPDSREAWAKRADRVRHQMLVALGLWPMPEKTDLHAVIHGRMDLGDYTVEKVYFESLPGFFVTGSLYRPKSGTAPHPAVLCPHGHWSNGRFYDQGLNAVRREIVQGAERFEDGGRSPLQSRCVQLARMGCVVFHYDMIGYADSQQIPQSIAHGFAKQRPEMNTTANWGLFSPQAEAHLQSVMGLQTWDSIRALDFILSLPDVDPHRVAVTGASGGGTQTFILCGIDPRPAVAFPAVMVSTAMQGGCTCENASLLRVGTGNVEFAALFAPKPLGMTAANDWTHEMPSKGYPQLQALYRLLGAPNNVMLTPLLHFGHNYNYVSRAAMYAWMNKQLHLGLPEPVVEEDYHRLTGDELTVWDQDHPRPPGGPEFERQLLAGMTAAAQKQIRAAEQNPPQFRELAGTALEAMIGRNLAEAGETQWDIKTKTDHGAYLEMAGLVRNVAQHETLPAIFLYPKQWNGHTVLWIDGAGKAGLYQADGSPKPAVAKLVAEGLSVAGVDLLFQGEFLTNDAPVTETRTVKNPREAPAYTFGYNPTLFAQRVRDLLTMISFVQHWEQASTSVTLAGWNGAGPIVAAARALAGPAVRQAMIDTQGFRFGKLLDYRDPNFVPGGAKYGDLPGLLALGAPGKTWVAGEGQSGSDVARRFYEETGAAKELTAFDGTQADAGPAAVQWLVDQLP